MLPAFPRPNLPHRGDVLNTTVCVSRDEKLKNKLHFLFTVPSSPLCKIGEQKFLNEVSYSSASSVVSYSTLQLTLLLIVGIITQALGI